MRSFIKQEIKVVDTAGIADDWYKYMVLCFEGTKQVFEIRLNGDEKETNIYALSKITDHCNANGISTISLEEYEAYKNAPWTPITYNHVPEMNTEEYEQYKIENAASRG